MSMRDEFEKWWSPQGHKTMMTDTKRTAWRAWQAAREQGAEPVAYLIRQEFTDRLEVFDHRDKGRDPKYYGSPFAVYTQPQSAELPEAFILRKQAEAVEAATATCEIKSSIRASICYSYDLAYYSQRLRKQADELEHDSRNISRSNEQD